MAKKKKNEGSDASLGEFDDWFADGDSDSFWDDEKVDALEESGAEPAVDDEAVSAEEERKAAEEAARKAEEERLAAEQAAAEQAAAEQAAAEEAARKAEEERLAAEQAAAEEAARKAEEERVAAEQAAAEEAAAEQAAAEEAAAAEQAAAEEAAAAEQAAAEEAAAAEQAAAEEAAAEEAAVAEQAAAEAAAAEQAAAEERAASAARAAALNPNPTIIADEDSASADDFAPTGDLAHEPETELAGRGLADDETEMVDAAAVAVPEEEDAAGDDEDELAATAEDFIGEMPDPTMILRRQREAGTAPAQSAGFDAEEVAQARAERKARRAENFQVPTTSPRGGDAPQPPAVPTPAETAAEVAPRRIAPSVPSDLAADRWAEAARSIERAAASTEDAADAAFLQATAGRIHFERLGNWDRAEELFAQAQGAGFADPEFLKAYADVVANRGAFEPLRDLLAARAAATSGTLAAEALQDAALVERNSLRRPEEAVRLLEQAVEQDGQDWFALRLLRELHYRASDWQALVDVLDTMASLVSGVRAARLQVERGRILGEKLSDGDGARAAFETALDAAPDHTPAFLAVERAARSAEDPGRLARLYQAEADRLAEVDGAEADVSFWRSRSLRAARLAAGEDGDAVAARFADAAALSPELRREQQAFLSASERWDDLAAALAAEATAAEDGLEKALALYRLGRLQEGARSDTGAAIDSFKAAAEADPAAGPAMEAATRLLAAEGRHGELVTFLEGLLDGLDDPNLTVTALYRMGEVCEGPLADQEGARTWFERILDTAPGYLPALEGLERVYTRLEAWDRLAAVYEQRAILAEEPPAVALQLHRAGAVCEFRLSDHQRARDFYRRALETVPDFPPSLDAYVRILEADGDWAGLARTLRLASEATKDGNEVVSLTYRSARILADRVGDDDQAMELLRRCLELSPGFLPAIGLLRELAAKGGHWQDVYDLHRLEADSAEDLDRRHWRMLAAAEVAGNTEGASPAQVAAEILDEDAGHVGALRLLEDQALASGDAHELLAVYQRMAFGAQDEDTRARLAVRIAELAGEAGDTVTAMNAVSEVITSDAPSRPLRGLARLAEGANYWEEAQRALLATESEAVKSEIARLQEAWMEDASAAARTWREVLEAHPDDVDAAAGLERALARQGERDGLAQAHAVLAENLPDIAVKAVHALLAGHLFEAAGELDDAVTWYEAAFAARPVPGKAFDALRRLHAQRQDADALVALFEQLSDPASTELASALEEAGAADRAVVLYQELLSDDALARPQRLAVLVRLEQDLVETEAWKALFETLGDRLALTTDADEREAIEARRRWVLAEHLAETDEAWDFYRQLHEESPEDTEILEALARIAGARGETGLAVQYLAGLAEAAPEPAAKARYERRIAEAHLAVENDDEARAALMKALDYEPGDVESLRLLKSLAEKAEDWQGVVGALAREATVLEGEEQIECYRQIARTWQDKLDNAAVAVDAWRKVLEVASDDAEALEKLVSLARAQERWPEVVEYGTSLVRHKEGAERSALLAELGGLYLDELHDEDEALRVLDAASKGEHPDLGAAQRLEKLHRARGQWDRAAEAVVRQARASAEDERVPLLIKAAEIKAETLHDRPGAAEIYGEVLDVEPDNVEALRFRSNHLFEAGQLDEAVDAFEKLEGWEADLDLDDFDDRMEAALYYYHFGEALRRLGRSDDALPRYDKALSFNQAHLPSLEAVGPIWMERQDWDKSADVYRQILQLIGGQGDSDRLCRTYTNLGLIEHHQGKLDKAKKRFTRALDLKANDVQALQGMARVLLSRQDWNNLLNVYNNIIYHAQEPEDVVDAYVTKGFVLDAKMELPDKAAQHYEKSLAFNPAQPVSLLRLAELALRRQDWPEAGSLADRGLALDVERKDIRAGLLLVKAVAHAACGDDDAAAEARKAALEADVALAGEIEDGAGPDAMHQVLTARLQDAP